MWLFKTTCIPSPWPLRWEKAVTKHMHLRPFKHVISYILRESYWTFSIKINMIRAWILFFLQVTGKFLHHLFWSTRDVPLHILPHPASSSLAKTFQFLCMPLPCHYTEHLHLSPCTALSPAASITALGMHHRLLKHALPRAQLWPLILRFSAANLLYFWTSELTDSCFMFFLFYFLELVASAVF